MRKSDQGYTSSKTVKEILNLEKARTNAKVMDRLKAEDGKILENQESIR